MPLVVVWIGQFCGDVIGDQNVKVVVIGLLLFFCCFDPSIVCSGMLFLFEIMYESSSDDDSSLDSEDDYRSGRQSF